MGRRLLPLRERLERHIFRAPGGCWIWFGRLDRDGYGRTHTGSIAAGDHRTGVAAHRVVYELHRGPIPAGLHLDHLCRVRRCVNPRHLDPVTSFENSCRGESNWASARRSGRCKRGHQLAGDNLIVNRAGQRSCRACMHIKQREWRERQKARAGDLTRENGSR